MSKIPDEFKEDYIEKIKADEHPGWEPEFSSGYSQLIMFAEDASEPSVLSFLNSCQKKGED